MSTDQGSKQQMVMMFLQLYQAGVVIVFWSLQEKNTAKKLNWRAVVTAAESTSKDGGMLSDHWCRF